MSKSKSVLQAIYAAVDEINEQLSQDQEITKSLDAKLFGEGGRLDSLSLVTLIVAIEQNIEDEFDVSVTIADERAMSQKHSPFKTIDTLANYIHQLLEEN